VSAPPADGPIRVLVADDHRVVRQGLRAFLASTDDIRVVGEASDGGETLTLLHALHDRGEAPDVVLMDLVMSPMDGIEATRQIRARYPEVQVVALTSFVEEEKAQAALEAGASGFLLKDADADEVAAAIRAARRGEVHLDPAIAGRLVRALRAPGTPQPGSELTGRERQVLRLVAAGKANKDIATELYISERTARTHVSSILTKLGMASRTQAALWAVREGLGQARDTPASRQQ
jgi:DNA-binding NarL/FixJ family response regulator